MPGDLDDELRSFLSEVNRGAYRHAALRSADGEEVQLPDQLFEILKQAATELANGRGVTLVPREAQLTTQQAADLLGVSRPTLIKLLESGAIPFRLVGRHRRVTLQDLETYRQQARAERRAVLRRAAREGQEAGLDDPAPDALPERT